MLKPTALAAGHYECRSLKQSLPILQDLLALELITANGDDAVLKHPNTGWKLIAHNSSARFCIKTGEVTRLPAEAPLKTYSVKVEEDQIWVRVP